MAYGVLNAKISAQIDEFERNMDRASGKLDDVGNAGERGGTKASKGLATLAKAAGIASVAIGVVIKKTSDMLIAVAGATDRVDKMSQKIGISRQSFQEWDFILSQSGASVDGLQMSLKTLSTATEQADRGSKEYVDTFEQLGVAIYDTNGELKNQEELFNDVFTALANTENQTKRTALASALLGRSATELSPAFNAGGDAIDAMRKQAHDLGLVLSDDLIDKGVVLTDNVDKLKRAYQGWRNEALKPLVELAVSFTDAMLGQRDRSKELFDSTTNLVSITGEYKRVTSELKKPVDDLTESERALLEIQQKRLQLQINQAVIDLGKNYTSTKNELNQLEKDEHKYQSTIQESLDVINQYTPAQREEIMNYRQTGRTVSETAKKKAELLLAESNLESAQLGLLDTQSKLMQKNDEYNARIVQITQAVREEQIELSTLRNINSDFADEVEEQIKILNARDKAMEKQAEGVRLADKMLAEMNLTTERAVQRQIDHYESIRDGYTTEMNLAMITRLLNQLYEKKAEILAENAKKTEDANEKDRLRNEIIENSTTAMQTAEQYALALGDSFNLNAEKASILETAIKALIDSGLGPASEEVQGLINKLTALGSAMETPTGGEDDPEDTGTYYEDELDRIRDFLASEQELLGKRFADRKALLDEALANEKMSKQEHDEMMKGLEEQYQGELTDIQKKAQEERNQLLLNAGTMMANNLISIYSNLVDATEKEGKRNFQLQKAASIAQAVVDGISAGISSYKAGSAIGGPVVGAAFAATSAAATGAMIAKLASASYGGGSSASVPTPSATTPAVQSQQTLLVQGDFDSSQLFSGSAVRDLIDKIGEAQKDGYTVVMA